MQPSPPSWAPSVRSFVSAGKRRARAEIAGLLLMLALAGCASRQEQATEQQPGPVTATWDSNWLTRAVTTPLSDLNLMRATIPPVLIAAQQAPYALPLSLECTELAAEIRALDLVLGADLDTAPTEENPGLIERGSEELGDAARREIQSAAADIIPYRSWIRRLTGAARYSREVEAAIAAGAVRRAFLKGLTQARDCRHTGPL